MINIFNKKFKVLALLVLSFFVFLPQMAGAVMYAPGATLAPACAPTDSNCGVTAPVYTSDALTDGALLFASSSAWSLLSAGTDGQVLKLSGGLPTWGSDDGGTSYTAGSGLSLTGSSFALNLANANTWSGLQTFDSGISLGGNTYTNLVGTGLSFASGVLSSVLGTSIESSEITDGTIVAGDLADSTITFGKLAQNSCATNEIIKWNGSAWACSADNNNTYTASTGLSLTSGAFALDINGLTAVSSVDSIDTLPVYTSAGIKKITRSDMFSDVLGSMNYRGTWNATTNSPDLSSYCVSGTKGHYYVVGTSGTTDLNSIASWAVSDWAVCNGTAWEKVQTTNAVTSVFGRTGGVVASGGDYNASQITNTANGNISAITVQNALNELDSEKLASTLNSGLIFIGNASNIATGVAISGDATIDNAGVLTIGADKVALGTNTTGNYIATLADSGAGIFTIANSGSESASTTIALADDILDFTKFADALTLDNNTSITLGGNDLTTAITGAGLPKFTRTSAGQWMNFADGTDAFGIYNATTTPEGLVAADKGSLAIDTTNGALYIKTTDTLNTGWSAFGTASSGVTSLNGLVGQTQTFATSTAGTDFGITSSGTTHTFSIPDASATARGLITTGTQTIAGAKTFSSAITAPTSTDTINGLIINSGALSEITGITMTSGNLDMANGLITNIGNAGTDFDSNGGLTLASGLTMSGSAANIILGSNYLSGDGGDEGISVDSAGNVGIGTTSPTYKLDVSGTGRFTGNVDLGAGVDVTGDLSVGTSDLFVDDSTGKVYIGTTADNTNNYARLTLNQPSAGLGSALFLQAADSGSSSADGAQIFLGVGATPDLTFFNRETGNITFQTSGGTERLRITNAGNVGIGTATPGAKLDVRLPDSETGTDDTLYTTAIFGLSRTHMGSLEFKSGRDDTAYTNRASSIQAWSNQETNAVNLLLNPSGGNVGIGTTNPGSYKLYVAGNAYSTGSWGTSDERYKTNITSLEGSLEKIMQLEGVTFNWKQDEYPDMGFDGSTQIGLIAQDVEQILPELVKTNDDGYKALAYDKITAVLIGAVQEQQKQLELLKSGLGLSPGELDNLISSGGLTVAGIVDLGKDSVGEAVIKAGATEVSIDFENTYTYQPVVTISKLTQGSLADYYVDEVAKNGFKIKINPTQSKDMVFSWHSFGSKEGIRIFSDGVRKSIENVPTSPEPPTPEPEATPSESEPTSEMDPESESPELEAVVEPNPEPEATPSESEPTSEMDPESESPAPIEHATQPEG